MTKIIKIQPRVKDKNRFIMRILSNIGYQVLLRLRHTKTSDEAGFSCAGLPPGSEYREMHLKTSKFEEHAVAAARLLIGLCSLGCGLSPKVMCQKLVPSTWLF